MKGIEHIAQAILEDAQKKANEIEQDAAERSNRVLCEAKKQADAAVFHARQQGSRYTDDILQKGMQAAQLTARMKVAAERRAAVNQTFTQAKECLMRLPDEQRYILLCKLLREALTDGLGGELLLNASDRENLGIRLVQQANQLSGEPVTLSKDTADIAGGLIVRRGLIEINCALDEIIRTLADEKSFAVMQILFA